MPDLLTDEEVGLTEELTDAEVGLGPSRAEPDTMPDYFPERTVTSPTGVPMRVRLPRDPMQSLVELPAAVAPKAEGEVTLSSPIGVPFKVPKQLAEQAGAALYNVAKPVAEFPFSPAGAAAAALPETALGRAIVQGTFGGLAAKGGGEALGEASVTGDTQRALEGGLMLGAAPFMAKPGTRVPTIPRWQGPLAKGELLRMAEGAKPSPATEAVAAVGVPVEGEPTTKLSPVAEAAVSDIIGKAEPVLPEAAKAAKQEAALTEVQKAEEQARLDAELEQEPEPAKAQGVEPAAEPAPKPETPKYTEQHVRVSPGQEFFSRRSFQQDLELIKEHNLKAVEREAADKTPAGFYAIKPLSMADVTQWDTRRILDEFKETLRTIKEVGPKGAKTEADAVNDARYRVNAWVLYSEAKRRLVPLRLGAVEAYGYGKEWKGGIDDLLDAAKSEPKPAERKTWEKKLPPVAKGYVRLYRGGPYGQEGLWFSDNPEVAEFHFTNWKGQGAATLAYIDIPEADALKYQEAAFSHPDVVSKKTIAEGGDHVLPPELAAQAKWVKGAKPLPPTAEPKPEITPKTIALEAQKEAGWNPKWPFVPADFYSKTFRDAIESDPTITAAEKDKMFTAAEKLLGGKIERAPEPKPEPAPSAKRKEPWQMTKAEYQKSRVEAGAYPSGLFEYPDAVDKYFSDTHRGIIQMALKRGRPVPPEVLADYPDLKPPEPAPSAKGEAQPWYASFGEETKQNIFAVMRKIQERVDAGAERERALRPRQGEIAAGATGFDEFVRSESQAQVLRAVRKGMTPEQAGSEAKTWAREAVAIHNKKRPKDYNWARDEGTADTTIERAVEELNEVAKPTPAPSPPAASAPSPKDWVKSGKAAQWTKEQVEKVAAATKAQAEVKKVARTEGQRSAKEVKSELVESLEQAIEKAPSEMGLSPSELEQVTKTKKWIHIPGDGDFNVVNSKEALGEVLKRAKRISTSPSGATKVPQVLEGKVTPEELVDQARKLYGTPENSIRHLESQLASGQEIDPKTRFATERAIELLREETAEFKRDKAIKELQASIADAEAKIKIGEEGKRVMLKTYGSRSRFSRREDVHWNQLEESIKRANESLTKDRAALAKIQEQPPTPAPAEPGMAGPGSPSLAQGPDPRAQIEQLTDSFRNIEGRSVPLGERIRQAFQVGQRLATAQDTLSKAIDGLKASGNYLIGKWKQVQSIDDLLRAKGDLSAALESRGWRVREWEKLARQATPSLRDQAAIAKYVDAGGDPTELRRGLAETKPQFKQAYQDALNLSGDLKIAAENIRNYFDSRLQEAIDAGVLEEGVEDYIHRIYESRPKLAQKAIAYLQTGILQKNPALTKKRIFQFDWEAEKLGYRPVQSYITRIAQYESSLARAIAAREFIKKATTMKAVDGRPIIDIKGVGIPIEDQATGAREATLIKPQFNPAKKNIQGTRNYRGDYVNKEFPALSRWKWVASDSAGKPIFVQGDVAIHPDYVSRVSALLEPSRVRYGRYGTVLRPALALGSTVKQTMLDLSGFHQVQVTVHGLEHRVMPWSILQDIDFQNPNVDGLLKGGVTLGGEYRGAAEGLAGSALTRHIPILGPALESYHQWLFQNYIPRLKMTMALHALERNKARYAGVKSPEEIFHLTASEANAAFGEQNYIMLERSRTAQDMARLILLAPDFLEARGRFAGQALTRGGKLYGNEQRTALLLGALAMYTTARVLNKAVNGQYHNEPENLFSVVHNGKAYGLRTVQGDILHLIERPLSFWMHRLNPVYARTFFELATGRDEFGRRRSVPEQLWDAVSTAFPIALRTSRERSLAESLFNSFGVTARRWSDVDDAFTLARKWKAEHGVGERGEFIYDRDKDPLRPLKIALTQKDEGAAAREINKLLVSKTYTQAKLNDYFNRYATMPFTGSRANDRKFVAGLSDDEKKTVEAARLHKIEIRKLYQHASAIRNALLMKGAL